jgi:3-hydroxyisobutyrate dehydrogenase
MSDEIPSRPRVGFLGLGHMGEPMAMRLARAGTDLTVWNRSPAKLELLAAEGARVATSPVELVEGSDVVITMLAGGPVTDSVLGRGASGFAVPVAGRVVVNMGTVLPEYSVGLARDLRAHGARFVEAPVSGSRLPAFEGALVAMVAGDPDASDALETVEAVIAPMVSAVFRCGGVPRAIETKLAANVFLIGTVTALAEAVHFARGRGLDPEVLRSVLDAGTMASALSRVKLAKLVEGDDAAQAAVSDVLYNNRLILDAAAPHDIPMPLLEVCAELFASAEELGRGSADMVRVIDAIAARGDQSRSAPVASSPSCRSSWR